MAMGWVKKRDQQKECSTYCRFPQNESKTVTESNFINYVILLWLVWLSDLTAGLQIKGLWVRFPVRIHSLIVDQVPRGRPIRDNHILMFLSILFFPLSKNK